MNFIRVPAFGAPNSFVRRVQERPFIAIDLLLVLERIATDNPVLPDGRTEAQAIASRALAEARRHVNSPDAPSNDWRD